MLEKYQITHKSWLKWYRHVGKRICPSFEAVLQPLSYHASQETNVESYFLHLKTKYFLFLLQTVSGLIVHVSYKLKLKISSLVTNDSN